MDTVCVYMRVILIQRTIQRRCLAAVQSSLRRRSRVCCFRKLNSPKRWVAVLRSAKEHHRLPQHVAADGEVLDCSSPPHGRVNCWLQVPVHRAQLLCSYFKEKLPGLAASATGVTHEQRTVFSGGESGSPSRMWESDDTRNATQSTRRGSNTRARVAAMHRCSLADLRHLVPRRAPQPFSTRETLSSLG